LENHLYPRHQGPDWLSQFLDDDDDDDDRDGFLKMLVYSPLNHLMWLLAREYFIKFSHHESFKLYKCVVIYGYIIPSSGLQTLDPVFISKFQATDVISLLFSRIITVLLFHSVHFLCFKYKLQIFGT
jgi:hypothetical protein